MNSANTPDWGFWRNIPEVELWQACALAVDLDPDKVMFSRNGWMAGEGDHGPFIESDSFGGTEQATAFHKRLRLLKTNLSNREQFSAGKLSMSASHKHGVKLSEFASWAARIGLDVPAELAALARVLGEPSSVAQTESSDARCARLLHWLREEEAKQSRGALARVVARDGRARQTVSADITKARKMEAASAGPITAMARIVRR